MRNIKRCTINKVICALSAFFIWLTLSGCIQSKAAGTGTVASAKPRQHITDNTLKIVNAAFYQTFVLGEWRYKGAQNRGGTINAYIQIPAPLNMTREVQKSYLLKAICPSSAHTSMWNEINGIPLSIHIYTHRQKNSLYVNCINPLRTG